MTSKSKYSQRIHIIIFITDTFSNTIQFIFPCFSKPEYVNNQTKEPMATAKGSTLTDIYFCLLIMSSLGYNQKHVFQRGNHSLMQTDQTVVHRK